MNTYTYQIEPLDSRIGRFEIQKIEEQITFAKGRTFNSTAVEMEELHLSKNEALL